MILDRTIERIEKYNSKFLKYEYWKKSIIVFARVFFFMRVGRLPCGIVANELLCIIGKNDFELHLRYSLHYPTNTFGNDMVQVDKNEASGQKRVKLTGFNISSNGLHLTQ